MELDAHETTYDLVHRLLQDDDEDVAGFRGRENSRLGTLCYCDYTFTTVLYLAYKYGSDDPARALLQNVMIGVPCWVPYSVLRPATFRLPMICVRNRPLKRK